MGRRLYPKKAVGSDAGIAAPLSLPSKLRNSLPRRDVIFHGAGL